MRKFTYRTWSGSDRTVEADYVAFEPAHVAFWLAKRPDQIQATLVLAVENTDCNKLREIVQDD